MASIKLLNWWRIFPDVFKCVQMEVYTYLDVYCILCVGSDGTELLPWEEIARTIHTAIFSDWTIHTVIGKNTKNTHSNREESTGTLQPSRVNTGTLQLT